MSPDGDTSSEFDEEPWQKSYADHTVDIHQVLGMVYSTSLWSFVTDYIYIFIIVLLPQLLLLLLLSLLCYFFIIFQMFLTDIRYCGSWKARSGRHEKEGLIAAVARLLHSNIASRQTEALLRTCKPSFLPVARRPSLIAVAPRDCW